MLLHYRVVITLSVDFITLSGSYYITGAIITLSVVTSCLFQDARIDFLRRFAIGFAAGVLGSVLTHPFDVARNRIMCQVPMAGRVKYSGCLHTVKILFTEEG